MTAAPAIHLDLTGSESLCTQARKLIRNGADPAALLYAWRGATLCFDPMPLHRWAGLTASETEGRSIHFRKYRPPHDRRVYGLPPQIGAEALLVGL